jgi:hypothetical protein
VQFNTSAEQIVASEELLNRLVSPIVLDHMGHIPQPAGLDHPAVAIIRRLIDKGRTWVKLSVTYDSSKDGPPGYADVGRLAQSYVKAAPERLVWGSNWPHPSEPKKPDDAALFDLMAQWPPTRRRATASWCAIRRRFTASRNRLEAGAERSLPCSTALGLEGGRDDRTSHIRQARVDGRVGSRIRTFRSAKPRR